jgi:hypothetical protein
MKNGDFGFETVVFPEDVEADNIAAINEMQHALALDLFDGDQTKRDFDLELARWIEMHGENFNTLISCKPELVSLYREASDKKEALDAIKSELYVDRRS